MNKPKTRKELANELGIHPKTLYRWLKKYNLETNRGLLTPEDQIKIYSTFGYQIQTQQKKLTMHAP